MGRNQVTTMAKKALATVTQPVITISRPNFEQAQFQIEGTSPYVQHSFSQQSLETMLEAQLKRGGTKGKKRSPRNLDEDYEGAIHIGEDGHFGIPASAFRSAMIDACRMVGFQMTRAKMSVFCLADTIDVTSGQPLVRIHGNPERVKSHVRLKTGVASVAIRPMWKGWSAKPIIQWDADQFSHADVANLLARAGMQVGIGEGRPYSKDSHGTGWGTFRLVTKKGK